MVHVGLAWFLDFLSLHQGGVVMSSQITPTHPLAGPWRVGEVGGSESIEMILARGQNGCFWKGVDGRCKLRARTK